MLFSSSRTQGSYLGFLKKSHEYVIEEKIMLFFESLSNYVVDGTWAASDLIDHHYYLSGN